MSHKEITMEIKRSLSAVTYTVEYINLTEEPFAIRDGDIVRIARPFKKFGSDQETNAIAGRYSSEADVIVKTISSFQEMGEIRNRYNGLNNVSYLDALSREERIEHEVISSVVENNKNATDREGRYIKYDIIITAKELNVVRSANSWVHVPNTNLEVIKLGKDLSYSAIRTTKLHRHAKVEYTFNSTGSQLDNLYINSNGHVLTITNRRDPRLPEGFCTDVKGTSEPTSEEWVSIEEGMDVVFFASKASAAKSDGNYDRNKLLNSISKLENELKLSKDREAHLIEKSSIEVSQELLDLKTAHQLKISELKLKCLNDTMSLRQDMKQGIDDAISTERTKAKQKIREARRKVQKAEEREERAKEKTEEAKRKQQEWQEKYNDQIYRDRRDGYDTDRTIKNLELAMKFITFSAGAFAFYTKVIK